MRRIDASNKGGDTKVYRSGTHRSMSPGQTISLVRPHMARMGITRIANVTGLDRIGIPVVAVYRPNARSLAVSQGKGRDLESAIASGLMEASELYHGEHIEKPLRLASAAQLSRSQPVIDVDRLARVKGDRFHRNLPMLWIEGHELVSDQRCWLPYECVRTDYTVPAPPGSGCFDCSSNGLASGNTVDEAICHAICEVIERDATALWNALPSGDKRATRVDLDTVANADCRGLLERFRQASFTVDVWETTSDLAVPSFYCMIEDRLRPESHFGVGAGSHLAPEIALSRALTEAAQVRTTYISGARDDLSPDEYSARHHAERHAIAGLLRSGLAENRDFGAIADRSTNTFSGDLKSLILRLRAVGVDEVVAIDISLPGIDIPVVRVVIPGLEGPDDHAGYLPGERAIRQARQNAGEGP